MAFNSADWLEANKIIIPKSAPASAEMAVFFNSHTGVGGARDVWHTVDLSDSMPENAVAIHVSGTLIITHGTNAELADLMMYFRRDSSISTDYNHQVIEKLPGNGQRCTMACWIPLTEQMTFDYKWHLQSYTGAYPAYSAYGCNLQIDAIAINDGV